MHFLSFCLSLLLSCAMPTNHVLPVKNDNDAKMIQISFGDLDLPKPPVPYHAKPKLKKHTHWAPTLKLEDEVTEQSVDSMIEQINQVNNDGAEAIILVINSPGGSVVDGYRLAETIEESKTPIHCLVDQGMAASMGSYLFEGCTTREITKSSILMFHGVSIGLMREVRENDLVNILAMLKSLDNAMAEHNVAKSKISKEFFLKKIEKSSEWWLNWEESYKDGLADRVVKSLKDMQESLTKDLKLPENLVK